MLRNACLWPCILHYWLVQMGQGHSPAWPRVLQSGELRAPRRLFTIVPTRGHHWLTVPLHPPTRKASLQTFCTPQTHPGGVLSMLQTSLWVIDATYVLPKGNNADVFSCCPRVLKPWMWRRASVADGPEWPRGPPGVIRLGWGPA